MKKIDKYAVINTQNGLFYNGKGNHKENTVWVEKENATLATKSFWLWCSKKNNENICILKKNIIKIK